MNYIGWISPNGELIRCDGYAHVAMAMDIVKKLYPNAAGQADDVLLSRGWMRISRLTYGTDIGLIFFLPQYPSEYQLSILRDIYEDSPKEISQKGLKILSQWNIILPDEKIA